MGLLIKNILQLIVLFMILAVSGIIIGSLEGCSLSAKGVQMSDPEIKITPELEELESWHTVEGFLVEGVVIAGLMEGAGGADLDPIFIVAESGIVCDVAKGDHACYVQDRITRQVMSGLGVMLRKQYPTHVDSVYIVA